MVLYFLPDNNLLNFYPNQLIILLSQSSIVTHSLSLLSILKLHTILLLLLLLSLLLSILLLFSLCPMYSHSVPVDHPVKHHQSSLFSSFPTTLSASSSFSFVSFALTSFSSSYPSFWFVSQSSSPSSSFPSQLSLSNNPDFEFDSETTGTSTSE